MASEVSVNNGRCASVRQFNATSCSAGKMHHSVHDLSANTNYTASMAVWNRGGESRASRISVITLLAAGEPPLLMMMMLNEFALITTTTRRKCS